MATRERADRGWRHRPHRAHRVHGRVQRAERVKEGLLEVDVRRNNDALRCRPYDVGRPRSSSRQAFRAALGEVDDQGERVAWVQQRQGGERSFGALSSIGARVGAMVTARARPKLFLSLSPVEVWREVHANRPLESKASPARPAASATERRGQCARVVLGALPAPIPGGAAAPDDYRMLA